MFAIQVDDEAVPVLLVRFEVEATRPHAALDVEHHAQVPPASPGAANAAQQLVAPIGFRDLGREPGVAQVDHDPVRILEDEQRVLDGAIDAAREGVAPFADRAHEPGPGGPEPADPNGEGAFLRLVKQAVTEVESGSAADKADLKRGDVIIEANRKEISDIGDFRSVLKEAEKGEPLLLLVKRGRGNLFIVVKPDTSKD